MPGTLDHVKLDGECHPRSNPGGEEVAFSEPGSSSGGCQLAPPCRSAGLRAGNRPPVIGGMLLVGIMNLVVSAEVIGRALLQ